MAYNDSGELPASQRTYSLGGYTFELKVQTVHEPGEPDVVSVFAICRGPDGTRETQAVDFPEGTTVESWSVECNETEASVYAKVLIDETEVVDGKKWSAPLATLEKMPGVRQSYYGYEFEYPAPNNRSNANVYKNGVFVNQWAGQPEPVTFRYVSSYPYSTYALVYRTGDIHGFGYTYEMESYEGQMPSGKIEEEEVIARFAIDIHEADTDSWDEPGDDGPPGTTLNVTVTGATAGSCTGTPSDNETVKGYGDGGDGGYGGGGGAGASTVIIYEFATSIAESVQQEAISRGPGTGGPGGKGGKGGDGCILIFY